jgi:hypothetical protein
MLHFLVTLWGRLSGGDSRDKGEVARIGALQQAAVSRRAEYSRAEEHAAAAALLGTTLTAAVQEPPSSRRRQMKDAESAYALALQAWDNRQSGLKSR